ncbi:MAG TPA: histidine kinase dimerization/phospho-acceptor domain-containing protein [Terracidiphilus sp.]|nr:histidine kinase dimerization/phospho-acceptor domain-containing protein [Terracidiphilus sp.]
MQDWYQMPALVLTTLLLPAFGYLYARTRDIRNLLWFLAFLCTVVRMALLYSTATWDMVYGNASWAAASGQALAMLAAGLFLGSLSPLSFRIGKRRILYAIPYTVPLIIYAVLSHGLYHSAAPTGIMYWVFPALGTMTVVTGVLWDMEKGTLPTWMGTIICVVFGTMSLWLYFKTGLYWPLILAEAGTHLITALLVLSVFRRFSPGVALSYLGFLVWSLPILLIAPYFHHPDLNLFLLRTIALGKVATALGLILLMLENELAANTAASRRERRARQEMEAYSRLTLSRRRVEDFDRQSGDICRTVVQHSRFGQAALVLLQPTGLYRLAGSAGLDSATARALDTLTGRIPVAEFLALSPPVVEGNQAVRLDLRPWLKPGDDLERLGFTATIAVPMMGRSANEGGLLLAGLKQPEDPLRADDLVPVEMLTARMQSVRSQTRMLEKLIDSEKFAGLGQLAGNVTQQLNNPLTVILGYAALLEETQGLDPQARRGVEAILSSARSMRSTLESLQRVARAPSGHFTVISVAEMLGDMERLHRPEFLQRSIEFRLKIEPGLPQVRAHGQQLRQAVLHCLQYAMDAVEGLPAASERSVRLEAAVEAGRVQIMVVHTGPGFEHPERAFDPFVPAQPAGGDTAGLGLSLCATILRDNRGRASAMNLNPQGATIVLELEAA